MMLRFSVLSLPLLSALSLPPSLTSIPRSLSRARYHRSSMVTSTSTRKRKTAETAAAELPTDDDDDSSSQRTQQTSCPAPSMVVTELFQTSGITNTTTKGGWCLQEGMTRVLEADPSGMLLPIVQKQGLPAIYSIVEDAASCRHEANTTTNTTTTTVTKPQNCFQSLCRIIAGQQLAGAAARAMWNRLNKVIADSATTKGSAGGSRVNRSHQALTPEAILSLAELGVEEHLRKPAGLSGAKARSIVALAQAFADEDVTEAFLTSPTSTEEDIRSKLLPIKGIGPWSCDMFLMFYLEKGNVLPVGDFGVRKGIAKFFGLKGKGHKGSLCNIKDKHVMEQAMAPYQPYQSLICYYMWAVADTKDFYRDSSRSTTTTEGSGNVATVTPSKATGKQAKKRAVITP